MTNKLVPQNDEPIVFNPLPKQHECWMYLQDDIHTIIFYGGAASGGKSRLAVSWLILSCIQNPGTRYGLTRSRLTSLKRSTIKSLDGCLRDFKLVEGKHYSKNQTDLTYTFWNGSEILCFDSFYYPSDPVFDKWGSMELTGCVIDECSETSKEAYEQIQTRLRYKHKEYNLVPKLLLCSNPTNNFIKSEIYLPYINDELPEHIAFVEAKADDNHYNDKSYVANLKKLSPKVRDRLLYGSWDYMDTDASIFDPDQLVHMYANSEMINDNKKRYISADIASSGEDKTCIMVWEGLILLDIILLKHNTTPQIVERIRSLMTTYSVQMANVIIDKTGVGTGVFDLLKGSVGFVANARPVNPIYQMAKDELYYKLADYINGGKIYVATKNYQDELTQELQQHQLFDFDKDGKTKITPKEKVKQRLGRSPDLSDAMMMRMYYETTKPGFGFYIPSADKKKKEEWER